MTRSLALPALLTLAGATVVAAAFALVLAAVQERIDECPDCGVGR